MSKLKLNKHQTRFLVYSTMGTLLGFWVAGSFRSVGAIVISSLGWIIINEISLFSSRTEFEVRQSFFGGRENRIFLYGVGICVLFTISAFCVAFVSSERDSTTQRDWLFSMFAALLTPSFIGIREGMGLMGIGGTNGKVIDKDRASEPSNSLWK